MPVFQVTCSASLRIYQCLCVLSVEESGEIQFSFMNQNSVHLSSDIQHVQSLFNGYQHNEPKIEDNVPDWTVYSKHETAWSECTQCLVVPLCLCDLYVVAHSISYGTFDIKYYSYLRRLPKLTHTHTYTMHLYIGVLNVTCTQILNPLTVSVCGVCAYVCVFLRRRRRRRRQRHRRRS